MSTCVLVPLKLDAFVLNEAACNEDDFKIAPIVQPNYTFLRLDDQLLEADILDHVELHASKPASLNARLYDLGSGQIRQNRVGVYVHWTLPPFYREGIGSGDQAAQRKDAERKQQEGFPGRSTDKPQLNDAKEDATMPEFRPVPNRWLVTRRLKPGSYEPRDASIPLFESWVVQSDAMRKLSEDTVLNDKKKGDVENNLDDKDLEVEVSPFVDSNMATSDGKIVNNIIEGQAEVFVGKKVPFDRWDRDAADREPSVDLNVMASTNPLLSDYQIHNSNIFSIVDNFQYGPKEKPLYLTRAQADYFVIGWHSEDEDDPMTTISSVKDIFVPSHGKRLEDCHMKLKGHDSEKPSATPWGPDAQNWLNEEGAPARSDARILCHSSMYDVLWNAGSLPSKVGARDAGQIQKSLSFAVGTSPLDALVAYFEAMAVQTTTLQETKDDILRLIHILGEASDGDVESLQKFADEAYKLSYQQLDPGTTWFWKTQSDPEDTPKTASPEEIKKLDVLNMKQTALDNLKREIEELRWKLFALWWTWVSSYAVQNRVDPYKDRVKGVLERLNKAVGLLDPQSGRLKELEDEVSKLYTEITHSKGSTPPFYQRMDPTVLFSRIGSGWEPDFSNQVEVRRHQQTVKGDNPNASGWEGSKDYFRKLAGKVPDEVRPGVEALLAEFYELRSERNLNAVTDPTQMLPHFHADGRNKWKDTQPWKPLFVEWEALYYHIPFELWKNDEFHSENKFGASTVQYTIKDGVDVSTLFDPARVQDRQDVVRVAGRNYLQPQAVSTFRLLLQQVFLNTNPTDLQNEYGLKQEDQQRLLDTLSRMDFVSAPLSAVTNSLLTVKEGSHLKPLVRLPHSTPVVMRDAINRFTQICPDRPEDALQQIDDQSEVTPYASSVAMTGQFYPLKPVQHGQLQFIKLNIVDKFGQAIHIVDPSPPRKGTFHTTSPIISESLAVTTIKDGGITRPNIVVKQSDPNACPFISLAPAINQPTRINAVFVHKVLEDGAWKWRRCSDWDSPIWGWIVVNYADSGIQFFFGDGQFYREIRFGSSQETSTGFKYLPFDAERNQDGSIKTKEATQMDHLISKFSQKNYLEALWDMINTSFHQFNPAPTTYSTFSCAIVGKPLALVNAGWSLEMAGQPRENWTTTDITNPSIPKQRTLLKDDNRIPWNQRQWEPQDPRDPNDNNAPESARKGYTFPIKLGDDARRYDGLVGYFPATKSPLGEKTSDLDLDTLYTYPAFVSKSVGSPDPRVKITKDNYPRHTPYWISPGERGESLARHDDRLQVFGLIVDPFLPVNAFSGILPTKALKLPPRTVELALQKMTAFWHVGPLVVARDVDKSFSEHRALDGDYAGILAKYVKGKEVPKDHVAPPAATTAPALPAAPAASGGASSAAPPKDEDELPTVEFPLAPPIAAANGGGNAQFVFLQPYKTRQGEGGAENNTRYNPYGIDGQTAAGLDAAEARLMPGPYTAVEGYLQIAKSLADDLRPGAAAKPVSRVDSGGGG